MNQRQLGSTSYPILFFMVDAVDHRSGKTGLSPAVTLSKNGGAFGAAAGAVSEVASGWYALAGNATDRNTLGALVVHATGVGADPSDTRYVIVSHDPFNVPNGLALDATVAKDDTVAKAIALTAIDVKIDTIDVTADLILEDSTELQTDWHDGGRLDNLLDVASGGSTVSLSNSLARAIASILSFARSGKAKINKTEQFEVALNRSGETDDMVRFSFWA